MLRKLFDLKTKLKETHKLVNAFVLYITYIYIGLYNRNHDIFTSMKCRYLLYINIVAPHNIKSIEYKQSYKRQVSFSIYFFSMMKSFCLFAHLYLSLLLKCSLSILMSTEGLQGRIIQWSQESINKCSVVTLNCRILLSSFPLSLIHIKARAFQNFILDLPYIVQTQIYSS